MADAEALALRRLLSKAAADIAVSPGPPLPRSHPSPALLSKLQLNIYNLLDASLQQTAPASLSRKITFKKFSSDSQQEVWPEWRSHLQRLSLLSAARSHKWLGVEAGEASRADVGSAVAWLQLSQKELSDLTSPKLSTLTSGKGANYQQTKAVIGAELERIQAFLKVYKKMNDTVRAASRLLVVTLIVGAQVMFQPVPSASSLLSMVPSGRSALMMKTFQPPAAAFTVTSNRPVHDPAPDLSSMTLQDSEGSDDSSAESDQGSTYAPAERMY